MKKSVLFSILALSASVFADGNLEAAAQKMNGKNQQQDKDMKNNNMMNTVVLTSARPESDNGWYLFADALYWHADVGNADWGEKHVVTDSGPSTYHLHHLDFKWSWGFKVGIGVNMDHDMWDTNLYYTWFHTENSNAIGLKDKIPAGSIQGASLSLPSNPNIKSARHKWTIHFSMFDWELGRWQYSSKSLALRPHVGIKGGWINQDRKVSFGLVNAVQEKSHFENEFWGVGPSAGVNTMWVLGNAGSNMDHRFSLFGDVAGALMYGHFHNTYSVNIINDGSQKIKNMNRNLAVPMLQAIMGLSWDTAFNRNRNHFMLKVGYEFQYWFRQNQFLSTNSVSSTSIVQPIRYSDDLALQGLTTELRFDF